MQEILSVTTAETTGAVAVLTAVGEIDHDSREALDRAAAAVLHNGGSRLVIDLSGVSFCDSGGLSLFLDLHKATTARGGSLGLAGAAPAVLSVIHTTNLERLLALHPSVEDAVRAEPATG